MIPPEVRAALALQARNKMFKNSKTYIFDFDGTLVDSMPHWSQKMINILEQFNVDYPKYIIKIITPLGDKGTAKYYREVLGVPLSDDEMLALMDKYALPKYRDEIGFKDGVYETLETLKEQGASLNVLTASPHRMLDPCLKRLGVFDMFDNVWSCDDFGTTKADVGIYTAAAEKLGVSVSDIVFLDDNIGAVKTAKAAGMQTVGVYDPSGEEFTDALRQTADRYVVNLKELLD
jgi:HAD superfamily hydrolase (TIGR01509 family)